MPEIKAVIFDAGGVLQKTSGRHFLSTVRKRFGFKPKGNRMTSTAFNNEMNLGQISVRQMLKKMYPAASGKQLHAMLAQWEKEWPTDWKMIGLAKKLSRRYTVSILSNSDPVHEKRVREEGVLALFETPVLSHKVGLIKPDKKIFILALKRLGLKAPECVFIDDTKINTVAAKKLGFKVINFKNRQQCERELKNLGAKI